MEIRLLSSDDDFIRLLPLLLEFTRSVGDLPLYQCMREVSSSIGGSFTTWLSEEEGALTGYLTGYVYSPGVFFITQCYSNSVRASNEGWPIVESQLREKGFTSLLHMTKLNPRVFRKRGFTLKRYLMEKEVK